jgi:colicin import membrane protein
MKSGWFTTLYSSLLSLLLHAVVVILLIVNFSFSIDPPPVHPKHNIDIVKATTIDQKQLENELKKLKKAEKDKKAAEKKRLAELEKKAANEKKKADEAKKKRIEEENKLKAAKKKKEQELKNRKLEQEKLAKVKKEKEELDRKIKLEEEERRKAEEERKRKEEAEKKRKAEEERKSEEEEKRLQDELAAEEHEAQQQADMQLINKIAVEISEKVSNYFNKIGLPENLKCTLRVKLLPSGEVIDASIEKSSGNDIFDRRAQNAVQKASPLPVPDDIATFERLNLRDIPFTFIP